MQLLDRLSQGPLLADGGMGTQLMEAGLPVGTNAAIWNADRPDTVRQIHERYHRAGCRLLTTNTFQGTRPALDQHGLGERVAELNEAGARLARAVADGSDESVPEPTWVLADAGPFGGFLEPLGDTTLDQAVACFAEQFAALRAGGADVALVETMSDPGEVAAAIRAAREVADWPVIATYAFQKSGAAFTTMIGTTAADAVAAAIDAGADIVGANCGTGLSLEDYTALAAELAAAAGGRPVAIQANAGAPISGPEGMTWPADPEAMAAIVPELIDAGVRVIGGCCGTTPDHLAAMHRALRPLTHA